MTTVHVPVLLKETLDALKLEVRSQESGANLVYLDGTLGGGGHARVVAKTLEGKLTLIGLDRSPEAIAHAEVSLKGTATKLILANESFRNLDAVLDSQGIETVDRILLDLGLSSDELDNSGKGFTFMKDEPLLMTMGNPEQYPFTAKTIVNEWDEEVIANIIFGYAEDRFARRISRAIVNYRDKKKIETSGELAEIVKSAVPAFVRRGKIHPATKTFQALRIAVNDELHALREGLAKGYDRLAPGGVMAVISFHSLEDRIVKEFFKEKEKQDGVTVSRKPIIATSEEILDNPRSRSAKLRILEKQGNSK